MAKNPGPKLFTSQFGGEQPIPPEFVAAMQRREEVQAVPNEEAPETLSDEIVESKVATTRTNERVRTTVKKVAGNVVLTNIDNDQQGNPVKVTRTLYPTGSVVAPFSSTAKVKVQDLGNGWSIQEEMVDGSYVGGVFVPGIFEGPRYEKSIPDVVPERFRVAVPTLQTDINVEGTAAVPDLLAGDLSRYEQQTNDFLKRTGVVTRAGVTLPVTLSGKETDDHKKVVTVVETYKTAGVDVVPTATKDVVVQNLGDGRVLQTEKTIPSIFTADRFEINIPDVVPERFRVAVPATTTETDVLGTATPPVLSTGDLSRSEQQVDVFKKKTSVTTRAGVVVPQSLVGKETNDKKQIVTVTDTYKVDSGAAVPSATKDVKVQNLGDGRVIQTEYDIPAVFVGQAYSAAIEDTIPPEFKALIVRRVSSSTAAGTSVSPPTLGTNEFRRVVTQVDAFDVRTESETRDAVSGGTLSDKYFGGPEADGSVFSGLVSRVRTFFPSSIPDPDASFLAFKSRVEAIGAGASVKQTDTFPSAGYPVFYDYITDTDGFTVRRTKTIVDRGTLKNPGISSIRVLDSERALRIDEFVSADLVTDLAQNTYRVYPGKIDINLPMVLKSVTIGTSAARADGYYGESGTYTITGNGSGGVNLNGRSNCSAELMPEVIYDIFEPNGSNVWCMHYLVPVLRTHVDLTDRELVNYLFNYFFGPSGTILSGPSILSWPRWCPKAVNIITTGERVSRERVGNIHAYDSLRQDYNGAIISNGGSRTAGAGETADRSLMQKTTRLPPTIHAGFSVPVAPGNVFPSQPCGGLAGLMSLPSSVSVSMVVADAANADYSVEVGEGRTVNATPGSTSIPTSGSYLYRVFVEPLKYDYVLLHFVVVDFSDIQQ